MNDNTSPDANDELIDRIATSYAVKVYHNHRDSEDNQGRCSGRDIFLGNFVDADIKLVAFFHELGHSLSHTVTKQDTYLSTISSEGLAWELGLGLARDFGFKYGYYSKEMKWAREQLKTYIDGEHYKELERNHERTNSETHRKVYANS